MSDVGGAKSWFSAADLAELSLPGLPKTKRKINELALDRQWAFQVDAAGRPLARHRAGRGGGMEYHRSLLPPQASLALIRRGIAAAEPPKPLQVVASEAEACSTANQQLWSWFERQTDAIQTEARRRLGILDQVERLVEAGMTRSAAVASIAIQAGVSAATIWNWDSAAKGCDPADRLPRLAPKRKGGGAEATIDPRAWQYFRSDYLRPERPTVAACHQRLLTASAANGWGEIPHPKTLQRKIEREVDRRVVILQRNGAEALRGLLPPQKRSVADLHAMQLVNIDGHKWDVFVRWPDGSVGRPMMVAIQDVYSRKTLAWRVGPSESASLTRLAFADLFRNWGVPKGCLLDNGRAFASKWITGGAKTRYRFTIREDDPTGLLPALGVNPHWATPYRGQSKPIERSFQLVCEYGAKHPAFAGAYTGNKPDAKPENYGERAIDLDIFIRVAGQVIAANNARAGRRTEMANGRSYDEVFQESYARAPIGRATPEQLRLALLTAEKVSADRKTGAISLYGNSYWAPELGAVAGEKVVVRFDPDALHTEVHVYGRDGAFLATAPVQAAVGFLDRDAAVARARLESAHRKAARAARDAQDLLTAAQLADLLPRDVDAEEVPSPAVIRPVRVRTSGALALARTEPDAAPPIDFMDRFVAAEERLRVVK